MTAVIPVVQPVARHRGDGREGALGGSVPGRRESSTDHRPTPTATYLLPIKADGPPADELTRYLRAVGATCELIVVDGSAPPQFAAAHREWSSFARHVPPDADLSCLNGKVRGVLTGLRLSACERVVIADDDVRYDMDTLDRVIAGLDVADVVVPQNYFDPLPWHARWDTARTLLNRATGGDFPGTLAVRRALLRDGYDGDVLFENLELIRTIEARGGVCRRAPELFVRRLPPSTRHFVAQRVRQAYDELARPGRCTSWLAVMPVSVIVGRRRRGAVAGLVLCLLSVALAEWGRRRCGGRQRFPSSSALFAPLWVAERSVCIWLAVVLRLRGGVRYNGSRIVRAATPVRQLRRAAERQRRSAASHPDASRLDVGGAERLRATSA